MRQTPWLTTEILTAIMGKHKAERVAEHSSATTDIAHYKHLKDSLKIMIYLKSYN